MGKYDCITRWLKTTKDSADKDKSIFEDWVRGRLTTPDMKKSFCENNKFPELAGKVISDELMIDWLRSIGWRK